MIVRQVVTPPAAKVRSPCCRCARASPAGVFPSASVQVRLQQGCPVAGDAEPVQVGKIQRRVVKYQHPPTCCPSSAPVPRRPPPQPPRSPAAGEWWRLPHRVGGRITMVRPAATALAHHHPTGKVRPLPGPGRTSPHPRQEFNLAPVRLARRQRLTRSLSVLIGTALPAPAAGQPRPAR